jgi:spermidine synthase
MHKVIPPGALGNVKIEHFEVGTKDASFSALRAAINPWRSDSVAEGKYVRLFVGHSLMMSDTSMEKRSNMGVIYNSHGNVLIAGLGIGMVLLPILENPEVTSVTVIEKYADVVALVEPPIRKAAGDNASKLTVITADIFDWAPPKGQKWDTIYFDIWADICTDNLDDMAKLHKKFARRKTPGAWMYSWQKDSLKSKRSREKRSGGWF